MKIALIVAMTRDRLIGRAGRLPWHEPEDLRHFKRTTTGHAIIMGRRTFESIGKPLPNRRNLVVSRTKGYAADGAEVFDSLDAALRHCRARAEATAFIIGGAQLYTAALPIVDEMIVTWVERPGLEGDTFFPEFDPQAWTITGEEFKPPLRFVVYRRNK